MLVHLDTVKPANLSKFPEIISFWGWYIHPATLRYPSARKMFWAALNGEIDSDGKWIRGTK